MAKQMLEIGCRSKSVNNGLGNYVERTMKDKEGNLVEWSEEKYIHYNKQPKKNGMHDHSRAKLNFEINLETGKAQEIDRTKPQLQDRWQSVIDKNYTAMQQYMNPKTGEIYTKKRPIRKNEVKYFEVLLGGDRARMHQLAYDREVQLGKDGIGKNGDVQRLPEIERWAEDCYRWACDVWGKDNIITFSVNLDETNPHIHCDVVPLIDGRLSYSAMMCSEMVKGEKRGSFKQKSAKHFKELHNSYADIVGVKWGLERGESIQATQAKHISTKEYQAATSILEEKSAEIEALIAQKQQAEKAITKKIENLEGKFRTLQVTEEEYNTKIAHHQAKLEEVKQQLAQLTNDVQDVKYASVKANTYGVDAKFIRGEINGVHNSGQLTARELELLRQGTDVREVFFAKFGSDFAKDGYKLKI